MKKVYEQDLVIGKLYSDVNNNGSDVVTMRYKGVTKIAHEFEYVSGRNDYIMEDDNIIRFSRSANDPDFFWESPEPTNN